MGVAAAPPMLAVRLAQVVAAPIAVVQQGWQPCALVPTWRAEAPKRVASTPVTAVAAHAASPTPSVAVGVAAARVTWAVGLGRVEVQAVTAARRETCAVAAMRRVAVLEAERLARVV